MSTANTALRPVDAPEEDGPMNGNTPELDLTRARQRQHAAGEEAKRLEDAGHGREASAAWERYELIRGAIEAQDGAIEAQE